MKQHGIEHSQDAHQLCLLQSRCEGGWVILFLTEDIFHPTEGEGKIKREIKRGNLVWSAALAATRRLTAEMTI